jgi:hypothetical protein
MANESGDMKLLGDFSAVGEGVRTRRFWTKQPAFQKHQGFGVQAVA